MSQTIESVNPATEEVIASYPVADVARIEEVLQRARSECDGWRRRSFSERGKLLRNVGRYLRHNKSALACIITDEMGKTIGESEAEVEKCAWNCEFYAEKAAEFLGAIPVQSSAASSRVQFTPLGVVLAIMPWNFPFWQTFRFAAPALMAGNTAILKHASNVPGCAQAIERAFVESGCPKGVFQNLFMPGGQVEPLIADPRIAAVTLTGSDTVGSRVAAAAGRALKKAVLELGGSDPFIVLPDADLDLTTQMAVRSRFQNAGQSCIAAKRFIVTEPIFAAFRDAFTEAVKALRVGDPRNRENQMGPMARGDLRDGLHEQVERSVREGAVVLTGGRKINGRGFYYEPTVLSDVRPRTVAACEETFGPVAALMPVHDLDEAVRLANDSSFGLGASVWTRDVDLASKVAGEVESGQVFINGMVASDPRLPFGGVKRSGYGRELADFGIREFVNIQTVWIGPAQQSKALKQE